MAAFAVVRLTITDMEAMGPYSAKAGASVAAFDGNLVFRGQVTDDLEGTSEHPVWWSSSRTARPPWRGTTPPPTRRRYP